MVVQTSEDSRTLTSALGNVRVTELGRSRFGRDTVQGGKGKWLPAFRRLSFSETLVTTHKTGVSQPEHCILDFAIASLPNSQLQ